MTRVEVRRGPLPITRRLLGEGFRGLIGWGLGLTAVALLYLPLFPSMQTPELQGLLDSLPPELIRTLGYENITSGSGYAQSTFFGLMGFVLLTIAGVSWAGEVTGGAEESGRLELTLAHGVGRTQYALEAALAVLIKLGLLGALAWAVVWAIDSPAQLELDPGNLLAVVMSWVGLGLFSATAGFAGGALSGRRIVAVGAGAGVAVAGYALQAVANNSEDLEGLRAFSPYAWAFGETPLAHGWDLPGLAALWLGSAALVAVGTVALSRRDILG